MPSSRRGPVPPNQRPLAVRGDSDRPYEKSRKNSTRHGVDARNPHSTSTLQSSSSSVAYPPSSIYPDRSDAKDQQRPQLPSLRTVIDLPPLQPQYGHQPQPQQPPQSPYPPMPKHAASHYGSTGEQNIISGRPIHTPVSMAAPSPYFENHADPRNRPSSRSSGRTKAVYGAPQGHPSTMSPTSTAGSAYYADRLAHQIAIVESDPPAQISAMRPEPRLREPSLREDQHLSLITDKRAAVNAAGPAAVPRCVEQRYVNGKGLCYIYEDGSFCEAVVRGEPVNPDWGLTRAGRARKRLAKACNSCREKKVKCEPGNTYRCQRCSRKGQDCQWSQYAENSPERDSSENSVARGIIPQAPESVYESHYDVSHMPLTPPYTVSGKTSYEPVPSLPDLETRQSSKRLRSESPFRGPVPHMVHGNDGPNPRPLNDMLAGNHEAQKNSMLEWETDPYHSDPVRASKLLHTYFDYRDSSVCCVLPRESFWHWVRNSCNRSRDEKVLLYAVLALGSLFSPDVDLKETGARFANLGRTAEKDISCQHSLPLALARLHLAFYHFANGNGEQSCYFIHASCRTLNALQLNVQEGIMNVPADPAFWDFGLNRVELIECRRRVFWLGYLTERHCSFASSITLFSLNPDDIFIHLPNNERHYQTGADSMGPLFDSGHHHSFSSSSPSSIAPPAGDLGAMTLSITIASIYGDVLKSTYRSTHRSRSNHPTDYRTNQYQASRRHEAFTTTTLHRLADWEASLPGHLQYSQTNTWRNIRCGDFSVYLVLQCIYHATKLHLARFAPLRDLPADVVRRNIRDANAAARDLLALTSALARSTESPVSSPAQQHPSTHSHISPNNTTTTTHPPAHHQYSQPSPAFAHPIIPHAIILAADTLSSAGNLDRHLRDTLKSLSDALVIVERCARFFRTARDQELNLRARIGELQAFAGGYGNGNGAVPVGFHAANAGVYALQQQHQQNARATWRCAEPCLQTYVAREADAVYGVEESLYLEAMADAGGWPDVRGVPGSG